MKTSCFSNYNGDKGVAICIYPPSNWTGASFQDLCPDKSDFYLIRSGNMTNKEYEKSYRKKVLSKLNPQEVYDKLKDSVLLCWEKSEEFCHRRIVAAWIKEELGIEVPEWSKNDDKNFTSSQSEPLF